MSNGASCRGPGPIPGESKAYKTFKNFKQFLILTQLDYTLSTYSPVSVLTRTVSPSLMNSGALTSAPVSSLMILDAPLEVSPLTAGGASVTFNSIFIGNFTPMTFSLKVKSSTTALVFKNFPPSPIWAISSLNLFAGLLGSLIGRFPV